MNLDICEGHRTYLFQMTRFVLLHKAGNKLNTRMGKNYFSALNCYNFLTLQIYST